MCSYDIFLLICFFFIVVIVSVISVGFLFSFMYFVCPKTQSKSKLEPQLQEKSQPPPQTPRTKRRIESVASDHSYHSTKATDPTESDTVQRMKKSNDSHASIEPNTSAVVTNQQPQQQQQQQQRKNQNTLLTNGTPEKVLDLIKRDNNDHVKCLVKYKGLAKAQWVLADEIRRTHPLLLIDYYETRIILRKNQCEMAFDCTDTATTNRKLVVVTAK